MCGRTALDVHYDDLGRVIEEIIHIRIPPTFPWGPRYNIAPMHRLPVVISDRGEASLELYRWGLVPAWAKDPEIDAEPIETVSPTIGPRKIQ